MRVVYALLGLILGITLNEMAHRGAQNRPAADNDKRVSRPEIGLALDQDSSAVPSAFAFTAHDFYDP